MFSRSGVLVEFVTMLLQHPYASWAVGTFGFVVGGRPVGAHRWRHKVKHLRTDDLYVLYDRYDRFPLDYPQFSHQIDP